MAIERARTKVLPRPWGVADLTPWNAADTGGAAIGEVWYERALPTSASPALLLKLLLTSQPLSIQVHPDDAYARSIGLASGKTEAWYVLSAAPGAKVALGLKRKLTEPQLRAATQDGSIADLVVWREVAAHDAIFVPAGTIHAIGAGLVIAEIQQRSDATFRLFDHGRQRPLHIEHAMEVADTGPAHFQVRPNCFTDERTILVSSPHFVLERIDLAPNSSWRLDAKRETWLLVLSGTAVAGGLDIAASGALFAQLDCVDIQAGGAGMVALAAYTGVGPVSNLLRRLPSTVAPILPMPSSPGPARAVTPNSRLETTK